MNHFLTPISIFLVFLACSCQSGSDERPSGNQEASGENGITEKHPAEDTNSFFTIPFAEIVKNKREVPLSEFAESVEFIRFETSEELLLGSIMDIQITKDYIFLHHNGTGLLTQYSIDGKFIRHFGALGRGPQEYLLMRKFSLDEENELVYIHTNWTRKILVFNFNGEYVNTLRFSAIERGRIVWSRDRMFISFSEPQIGNEPYVFIEHDKQGDTLQATANHIFWEQNEISHFMVGFWGQNTYYRFDGKLHMKSNYNDTVFSYNRLNEIVPKYFIDLGKHKIPDELVYERKSTRAMPKDCMWIGVHETSNYIFIPYGYHINMQTREVPNTNMGCILFDKNKKEGVAVIESSLGGFINDLSGGPDFKPIYTSDNKAYAAITALDMKLCLESDDFKNQSVKYPEQKEELMQMNNTLKEDDNHFLMVVNLK
jgi:hypothetical protein